MASNDAKDDRHGGRQRERAQDSRFRLGQFVFAVNPSQRDD
jgi:hypothetical protein